MESQGRTRGLARLRLAVAIAVSSLGHSAWADAAGPRGERGVILLGSSSVNQAFGHLIAEDLEGRGFRVTRKGVSAAGLARPDFRDINEIVQSVPINRNTAGVFIYLGVNDGQSLWLRPAERDASGKEFLDWNDPRWPSLYTSRTRQFVQSICRRGARKAIMVLPIDVERPRLQARLERVRRLQRQAALATTCGAALSTAGDAGRFEGAGESIRTNDGIHMTRGGAQRVWERIRTQALRLLEGGGNTRQASQ
jgi:hypothetical protein